MPLRPSGVTTPLDLKKDFVEETQKRFSSPFSSLPLEKVLRDPSFQPREFMAADIHFETLFLFGCKFSSTALVTFAFIAHSRQPTPLMEPKCALLYTLSNQFLPPFEHRSPAQK